MNFEAAFQDWLASLVLFLPKLIAGIVIFILSLVAAGYVAKAVKRAAAKRIEAEEVVTLIGQISRWAVIIIGTIIALDQVDFNVTGFIAGLGVAGFTIGFALQDIAKNLISGLILLNRQPFKIGDFVQVSGHSGTVKMINIRDTEIQTLDGDVVIIPNNQVVENPIINLTTSRLRRRSIGIGLGYEEDVDRTIEVFLAAIKAVEGVEAEPEPMIQVMNLGETALSLTAFYWVNQKENSPLKVHTAVVKAINSASLEHNIDLPYPTQTVLVRQANSAGQG
jgi:small-conductance mechanosensitive channel